MNKKEGFIYVVSAVLIWAISTGFFGRWINLPGLVMISLGTLMGVIFVVVYLFFNKDLSQIHETSIQHWKPLVVIGFLIGLNNGLYFMAIKSTSIANATLSHYLAPIILVSIVAPIILKSPITKKYFFSAMVGLIGLFIVLWSQITSIEIGVIYGISSAIFFAIHTALQKKIVDSQCDKWGAVFYTNLIPALMFSPWVVQYYATNNVLLGEIFKVAIWGFLVFGLSFYLLYKGLEKINSQTASILYYGEPIGAMLIASFVWGEVFNFQMFIGASLILVAGILVSVET